MADYDIDDPNRIKIGWDTANDYTKEKRNQTKWY
jgi:hypothetical protein